MIPMAWWEWLGQLSRRYARKWSEIGVKTRGKISLNYTSKILELEASREDQQLQQKDKNRMKGSGEKKMKELKDVDPFPVQNLSKF